MISGMCRFAHVALAVLALSASACTITLGTGAAAQQPQAVYWVDTPAASGAQPPAPSGGYVVQPAAYQAGATAPVAGPVQQAPTPVYTPSLNPVTTGPRHVGTPGLNGRGGVPVLPRGSVFGGDGSTFTGALYWVPVGATRMPDFASMPVQAVTSTDHLNIPLTNSQGSLPPWPDRVEGFGLEYKGTFSVAAPGTYDFAVYSDDGAIVYVDGAMVVSNDGIHDPQRADGKVTLTAGRHSVRIDYYLGYRWTVELQVFVFQPNGTQILFGPQI